MLSKNIKGMVKNILDWSLVNPSQRDSIFGKTIQYVTRRVQTVSSSKNYEKIFIQNAENSRFDKTVRTMIIKRFAKIDKEVDIRTTPTDGIFMAEALLSLDSPGEMVECGCFNGGSTAKLSILAKILDKRLYVFDSFEGLPEVDLFNSYDLHARKSLDWVTKRHWKPGQYAASLEMVKSVVKKYGEIEPCTFVKGWFNETLKDNLPSNIAFSFNDVDIPASAQECLLQIWPKLSNKGVFFSHDIAYIKVLQGFTSEHLWRNDFREHPPIFFGAGYGMCDSSPHLGFAVKGIVTAEYIKSLTYDKRVK